VLSLGKETRIAALGRSWKVGRLELHVIKGFRDWIAERIGDPYEPAMRLLNLVPPAEGMKLVNEARAVEKQLQCFSMQSALAKEHLATEEGVARLFYLLLQANHPDVSEEEAFQVVQALGVETQRVLRNAEGSLPNEEVPAAVE